MIEQLTEIIEKVYKPAIKDNHNPRLLTLYVLQYQTYRKIGLQHKVAIQKLQMDYNINYEVSKWK